MKLTFKFLILSCLLLSFLLPSLVSAQSTIPVNLPTCSTSNPEVRIINSTSDFNDLNSSNYRIFCVTPGSYGPITLSQNGTASNPRYLRYYNPNNPNDTTPPWHQSGSNQAVISEVSIPGDYWIIDGLTFRDTSFGLVEFRDSGQRNILNRILAENSSAQIIFRGEYNTVQNSVLRETRKRPSQDSHCITVHAGSRFHQVLNNEIYNCAGDGIQTYTGGHGLFIENNEFYLTNSMYSNCNGSLNPDGNCACAENAIDSKRAADNSDPAGTLIFRHNIAYGFRETDSSCASSGGGGAALTVQGSGSSGQGPSEYSLYERNIVYDSYWAFRFSTPSPLKTTVRNNLFYSSLDRSIVAWGRPQSQEIYNNTINASSGVDWIAFDSSRVPPLTDIKNNLIIRSRAATNPPSSNQDEVIVDYNAFLSTPALNINGSSSHDVTGSFNASDFDDHCFTIKKHTNPQTKCLNDVIPRQGSPVINRGDPNVGSRTGVGIDNTVGVATDLQDRSRDSQPDMGAFEYQGGVTYPTPTSGPSPTPTIPPTPIPTAAPGCYVSNTSWQNFSLPTQTGSFTVEYDATPYNNNMDGLTMLSQGPGSSFNDYANLVRFSNTGIIDVRNGGSYSSDASINYSANTSYHFRLDINVPAHTYSVYVTPSGGSTQLLANNFAFRSEQAAISSIDNWGINSGSTAAGTHQVCNFQLTSGTVTPTPPPTVPGDLDGNGQVDIFDLVIVGNSFGTSPGEPGYDPRADANGSGDTIDIFDLILVGSNFGR